MAAKKRSRSRFSIPQRRGTQKCVIMFFFFVLLVLGCVISTLAMVYLPKNIEYCQFLDQYRPSLFVMLGSGTVMIFVAVAACASSAAGNGTKTLKYLTPIFILIFGALLASTIIASTQVYNQFNKKMNEHLQTSFEEYGFSEEGGPIRNSSKPAMCLENLQKEHHCCGTASYKDWKYYTNDSVTYPRSCLCSPELVADLFIPNPNKPPICAQVSFSPNPPVIVYNTSCTDFLVDKYRVQLDMIRVTSAIVLVMVIVQLLVTHLVVQWIEHMISEQSYEFRDPNHIEFIDTSRILDLSTIPTPRSIEETDLDRPGRLGVRNVGFESDSDSEEEGLDLPQTVPREPSKHLGVIVEDITEESQEPLPSTSTQLSAEEFSATEDDLDSRVSTSGYEEGSTVQVSNSGFEDETGRRRPSSEFLETSDSDLSITKGKRLMSKETPVKSTAKIKKQFAPPEIPHIYRENSPLSEVFRAERPDEPKLLSYSSRRHSVISFGGLSESSSPLPPPE